VESRFGLSRKRLSTSEAAGMARLVNGPNVGVALAVVAGKAVAELAAVIVRVTVMTVLVILAALPGESSSEASNEAAPTTTRVARVMKRPNAGARSPKRVASLRGAGFVHRASVNL
jgi:hypothetical protein